VEFDLDGTNPPGANVFDASGHGTSAARALDGCSAPDAKATVISA
jgi:hypothetical protein